MKVGVEEKREQRQRMQSLHLLNATAMLLIVDVVLSVYLS